MKNPEDIAQWVVDNRYPKAENDKTSDFEMFQTIKTDINGTLENFLNFVEDNYHYHSSAWYDRDTDDYISR